MGFCMILYLAGLNRIPQDLYEAADIDGANGFQKFLFITIPQLNRTLVLNTLTSMTSAFLNNYALVEAMTGGGPFNATEVALSYTVKTAFQFNTLGKANAMSMVLFLLVFTFGCIQLKTMTKDVYE